MRWTAASNNIMYGIVYANHTTFTQASSNTSNSQSDHGRCFPFVNAHFKTKRQCTSCPTTPPSTLENMYLQTHQPRSATNNSRMRPQTLFETFEANATVLLLQPVDFNFILWKCTLETSVPGWLLGTLNDNLSWCRQCVTNTFLNHFWADLDHVGEHPYPLQLP